MANGEGVTFGDFDFYNSDAVLYRNLFGGGHVTTTAAFSRVQFPWDDQPTVELAITKENKPTNAVTGYRQTVHGSYRQENPIHVTSHVYNNSAMVSPMGAQAACAGLLQSHLGVQATNVSVPQSYVGVQQSYVDVPSHEDNRSAINTNTNHHSSGVPELTGSYQESPNFDSLKRRKKKRDPSYYDNFYRTQELHAGDQRADGYTRVPSSDSGPEPTALGDNIHVGPTLGKTPTTNSATPPSNTHPAQQRPFSDQSVEQDHSFSAPSRSDQLDDRTTGIEHEPSFLVAQLPTIGSSYIFSNTHVDSISGSQSVSSGTLSTSNLAASIVPPDDSLESVRESPVESSQSNSTPDVQQPTVPTSNLPSSVSNQQLESSETGAPQGSQIPVSQANSQTEPITTDEPEHSDATTLPSISQTAPVIAPKPSPWGNKPVSWAGLFQKEGQNSTVIHVPDSQSSSQSPEWVKSDVKSESSDPVTADKDPQIKKLGEYLKKVSINNKPMFIQPRGLINVANNCYINSILQVIVACPPFYNLFQNLPLAVKRRGPSSTPMLDAIINLCKQFEGMPFGNRKIRPGEPFEPVEVYQMLRRVNTTLSIKQGKQEDAEEFLSCLLNGFHDEMIAAMEALDGPKPTAITANGPTTHNGVGSDHEEEDEWEQVGPKKKATITRAAEYTKSPIYNIFGGQMRSALHQHGARESATLQPFFTLQLDIQSPQITSVKKALENFGTKEAVHGFMSNKTKTEVEASKRTSLEELPPVLILHLKQFVYDKTGGCQKLTKKMDYDMDLEINKDLLSPSGKAKIHPGQRTFKLFAVIYHTGKEASGGHYISDYFHMGIGGWIRADDNLIRAIKPGQVLNPPSGFTPYLLVYRRREVPPHITGSNKT